MEKSISIDIDGVLARNNTVVYLAVCNQVLKLGIKEEELSSLKRTAFLQHPRVTEYQARVGAETARRAFAWMYFHKEVLLAAKPFVGAIEAVQQCYSQVAPQFCYCTARYTTDTKWNQTIEQGTIQWLREQGFPAPESVVFCHGYQGKMQQLAQIANACPDTQHYHIDDSWQQLAPYLPIMPDNFHLIAFGPLVHPGDLPAGVSALSSWKQEELESITHGSPKISYFEDRR